MQSSPLAPVMQLYILCLALFKIKAQGLNSQNSWLARGLVGS